MERNVKINEEWCRDEFKTQYDGGESWLAIFKDHGFIGEYQFDVRVAGSENIYGVRVLFKDKRFYRNKLYITATVGNFEFADN